MTSEQRKIIQRTIGGIKIANSRKAITDDYAELFTKDLEKALSLGVVSNSEVFEHYGKPFTNGRDLWDFLTAHYNFTPKT